MYLGDSFDLFLNIGLSDIYLDMDEINMILLY